MFLVAVVSAVSFGVLFQALRVWVSPALFSVQYNALSARRQRDWVEHLVATIHAVIATTGALWCIIKSMPTYNWVVDRLLGASDVLDQLPCAAVWLEITLGYFVYDFATMLLSKGGSGKTIDFVHHGVSAASYVFLLYFRWALFIPLLLQTNEVSTPFLHFSWFMMFSRWNDRPPHIAVQLIFAALFIISRICFDAYVLWLSLVLLRSHFPTVVPAVVPVISFALCCVFYAVQVFWGWAILKRLRTACCPPPSSKPSVSLQD